MNQPPKSDPKPPQSSKTPLDFDDDLEDHGSPAMAIGMIVAIVVIGAFVAFSVVQRGKQDAHEQQAAAKAEAQEKEDAAPPDSAALDSLAQIAREAREAREAEEAKAAAEAAKAAQQAQAPVATLTEPPKFGINVGSFLFEDRANEVLSSLTESAGVEGRIVPSDDGSFAVVLGPFDSRSAAEAKGTELLEKGAVTESRVITLKD